MPVNTNAKVAIGFIGVVILILIVIIVLSIGTAVAANDFLSGSLDIPRGNNDG